MLQMLPWPSVSMPYYVRRWFHGSIRNEAFYTLFLPFDFFDRLTPAACMKMQAAGVSVTAQFLFFID